MIITQPGPVANNKFRLRAVFYLLRQLRQADGPVRTLPGQNAVMGQEQGVVHLIAPGVHGADDEALHMGQVPGHGGQGGHAAAGLFQGPGQALQGGYADAQAGEAARPVGGRQQVHILDPQPGGGQHTVHQGHQGAAVGQAHILIGAGQGNAVFHHGGGDAFGRGLDGKYFQSGSPPAMVMLRQPSFSGQRAMVTVTASGGRASRTFSLHSTAHTPPRSR